MYFILRGEDVELIPPSNTPHNKTGDFFKNNLIWESKCPRGKSLATIEHRFRKGTHQSENIVFDLRKFRGDELQAIKLLTKKFRLHRRIKRMCIITKVGDLIEFP